MSNYIYISPDGDGWRNLARDNYFLNNVDSDDVILYFYVNTDSVIIGRNQNAWRECNLNAMERDNVRLVRRHTGGGAVFHDTGNLNFSFIMNERKYDLDRQFDVIRSALAKLGINAVRSGRNDLTVSDKKFSGNAFGLAKGNRSHHGTLLVNTDLSRLANYLNPSQAKLNAKGITSVRSRVCNLADFSDAVTVEGLRKLIIDSFIEEYGSAGEYSFSDDALAKIEEYYEVQKSWEWRLGKSPKFDFTVDNRFSFGEMQIYLDIKSGIVNDAVVYTDALDAALADAVSSCLRGCRLEYNAIQQRLFGIYDSNAGGEISEFLKKTLFSS